MTRALVLAASVSFLASCGCPQKAAETAPAPTATGPTTPTEPTAPTPPPAQTAPTATATLESRSGSTATGTATFVDVGGTVEATIEVAGATPGKHGLHLHETGDCSAPDATSAGAHWNPDQAAHGGPDAPPHHAGDLGNIEVGADGKGKLTIKLPGLTLAAGDRSVIGRAVVLHASEDDLKSQPAGNAGARIACGVIR